MTAKHGSLTTGEPPAKDSELYDFVERQPSSAVPARLIRVERQRSTGDGTEELRFLVALDNTEDLVVTLQLQKRDEPGAI